MKLKSNQKKKLEEFLIFKLSNAKAVLGGIGDTPPPGGKDGDIDPPTPSGATGGPRRPE